MNQLPLFLPVSDWVPPTSLPEIPAGIPIAWDTETRDDGLARKQGAGWAWRGGNIAGICVAWGDEALYIPLAHPDTVCFDGGLVRDWVDYTMRRASINIFHNATYDLGWFLAEWGLRPQDYKFDDTQAMGVMLDENRLSYSLDNLCKEFGLPHKDNRLLLEAGSIFGFAKQDVMSNLWKMPARYVGPYGAQDARATLGLRNVLRPLLVEDKVEAAYQLEIDIMPCTIAMRKQGILIDFDEADRVQNQLRMEAFDTLEELRRVSPAGLEPKSGEVLRSPKFLERMFDAAGIAYSKTKKMEQGQFQSPWLKAHPERMPNLIAKWRSIDDLCNKFIGGYILSNTQMGRIHAEIHQLRDDESGTRSYRFSYANPPLQQMPARDEKLAPLVRGIFLCEPGELWLSADYSQQEPRMAVHFASVAKLPGYEQAVAYYRDNAKADFHSMVAEITGIPRSAAKIINLGVMYGMGKDKLAASLGVTVEEAVGLLATYNERMPFVHQLADFCSKRALARGYILLLDGAKCRWDMWQVDRSFAVTYEKALEKQRTREWRGTLRRAFTHKAMNRLCQGSAARQTKMAMRDCWREGIMPTLQMHDELAFSVKSEAQGKRICELMTNCVELHVPVYVDAEYGTSWGKSMNKKANSYEQAYASMGAGR